MDSEAPESREAELDRWREEARRLGEQVKKQAQAMTELWAKRARLFDERGRLTAELQRLRGAIEAPTLSGEGRRRWELASRAARRRAGGRAAVVDESARALVGGPPEGRLATSWPPLVPPLEDRDRCAPLILAEVGSGGSGFSQLEDPRILVRPLAELDPDEVDVLVFSRSNRSDVIESAGDLPDALWRRSDDRRLKVVFYAAREGWMHSPDRVNGLVSFLAEKGIKPADAVYITQDRGFRQDHQRYCRKVGAQPMHVWVHDYYIGETLEPFRAHGLAVFEQRLATYLNRPARRSRCFVSLNRTLRPTKLAFLSRLSRDGLWDLGWVSLGNFRDHGSRPLDSVAATIGAMHDFRDEAEEIVGRLEEIGSRCGDLFDVNGRQRKSFYDNSEAIESDDLPQYSDAWFTVVTETEMSNRLHRITEKVLKPMLSFHPFLILGSPGSLELVRGYGFQTFNGVLDERYDEEPDRRRRFDMVYEQFLRLCRAEEGELARMTDALAEVIVFNACWGLTELPRLFRDKTGAELVDGLLAL
jgi:hypothetical protein